MCSWKPIAPPIDQRSVAVEDEHSRLPDMEHDHGTIAGDDDAVCAAVGATFGAIRYHCPVIDPVVGVLASSYPHIELERPLARCRMTSSDHAPRRCKSLRLYETRPTRARLIEERRSSARRFKRHSAMAGHDDASRAQ